MCCRRNNGESHGGRADARFAYPELTKLIATVDPGLLDTACVLLLLFIRHLREGDVRYIEDTVVL